MKNMQQLPVLLPTSTIDRDDPLIPQGCSQLPVLGWMNLGFDFSRGSKLSNNKQCGLHGAPEMGDTKDGLASALSDAIELSKRSNKEDACAVSSLAKLHLFLCPKRRQHGDELQHQGRCML
jgi:hypothetical protein